MKTAHIFVAFRAARFGQFEVIKGLSLHTDEIGWRTYTGGDVKELIRTNNIVLISYVETLLKSAGIAYFVADRNISSAEGSIGMFPKRILVEGDGFDEARAIMVDAGLGDELRPSKPT